jgi:hypothetical protein
MFTDQVTMHIIEEEEVNVGVGDFEYNDLLTLLRKAQHNKPKKSHIAHVKPGGK